MGLWILDDKHLDHVPGTAPLADLHNEVDNGFVRLKFNPDE
jgi:hypothetical protein